MIKKTFFIAVCIIIPLVSCNVYAVYFTIHLKNGNKIKAENYWSEGQNIRFFTATGFVGLPNRIIEHISKSDGILNVGLSYIPESLSEPSEKESPPPTGDEDKTTIIEDLNDRISVIAININNLQRNKEIYLQRKEKSLKVKEKVERRLERSYMGTGFREANSQQFITSKNLKNRTDMEESRIADIEQKIKEVDSQIANTERMIKTQQKMEKRLKDELGRM